MTQKFITEKDELQVQLSKQEIICNVRLREELQHFYTCIYYIA